MLFKCCNKNEKLFKKLEPTQIASPSYWSFYHNTKHLYRTMVFIRSRCFIQFNANAKHK